MQFAAAKLTADRHGEHGAFLVPRNGLRGVVPSAKFNRKSIAMLGRSSSAFTYLQLPFITWGCNVQQQTAVDVTPRAA
jgi:hypothetical protein